MVSHAKNWVITFNDYESYEQFLVDKDMDEFIAIKSDADRSE